MRLISAKTLGIAALILALVWAVAEADEMMMGPGPHRGPFCMMGGGPGGDHMMPGPMMSDPMHLVRMAEELDLSADQRKQVGAFMDATVPRMRDLMFRMVDARKALDEYTDGEKKDDAALRKITDEHGKVMSEMMYLGIKTHTDMHAVLTAEQLQKMDEFKRGRHGFGGHKFNKRFDDDDD